MNSYRLPLVFALVLHLMLFSALFLQMHHTVSLTANVSATPIVKAMIVDQATIERQIAAIQQAKAERVAEAKARVERARKAKIAAVRAKAEAVKRAAAEKQAKTRAAKVAHEKQLRLAAEKKQKLAAKTAQKKALAAAFAKQLSDEQHALQAAATERQINSEVVRYKAIVIQAIAQHWIIPKGVAHDASCQLLVQLAPGGVVMHVDLVKGSGNMALDHSAEDAVLKASPLPVPTDEALFDRFRTLRLTVRPEGII